MKSRFILLLLVLAVVTGCNRGNVPLRGKVTFTDDGSPLTAGSVCFDDGIKLSRGTIKSDGTYRVGTEKETDGIPPGKYKVYIVGAVKSGGRTQSKDPYGKPYESGGMSIAVPLISQKHTGPKTSGWEITVDASTKTYDLKVDRP